MWGDAPREVDQSTIKAATRKALEEKIDQVCSILTSIETDVIKLRFGLTGGGRDRSCREIGKLLGIAPARVAEIETRAVAKLGIVQT